MALCDFPSAPPGADDDLDAILFMTSTTQEFAGAAERAAFHERWLGRYLKFWPDWCFAALAPDNTAIGYLAGCPTDPATAPQFADIGYYLKFEELCSQFPAHLHINVLPAFRKYGTGATLIEAFAQKCADHGIAGLHAITADGNTNNRFFTRCGLKRRAAIPWNGRQLAFFGRSL